MKTVLELREEMAGARQKDGSNKTVKQLKIIYEMIEKAHKEAIAHSLDSASVSIELDLTGQAIEELKRFEYEVEEVPVKRGEPSLYTISWTY